MQKSRGFTLIELMVVIAILGLLVAIAIPSYVRYTIRAKVASSVLLVMARDKNNLQEFIADFGRVPNDQEESTLKVDSQYILAVEYKTYDEPGKDWKNCAIIYTISSEVGDPLAGKQLALRPILVDTGKDVFNWECYSKGLLHGVDHAYLPETCRN